MYSIKYHLMIELVKIYKEYYLKDCVLYVAKIINEDDKYRSCRKKECWVKMDPNPYVVIYL